MKNFPEIDSGIYLGGQPSAQDLTELKQQGLKTVIDFRRPGETSSSNEELTKSQGLSYVNIPVDRTDPSDSAVPQLDAAFRQYSGPYLLHCGTGIRAITVYLLRQAQEQGWSVERTLEEAGKRGCDLAGAVDLREFVCRYLGRREGSATPSSD